MNTKQCIACKEEILPNALKESLIKPNKIQTRAANLKNKHWFNLLATVIIGFFLLWLIIGHLY